MITPDILSQATEPRSCDTQLTAETREALAVYFEGDRLKGFLPQFPKEDDQKYYWRQNATLENYDNYAKEIVEQYVEGVFRTKYPERETGDPDLDAWIYENYQKWFTTDVAPFALLCPELYVKIELPQATEEILTKADQQQYQGLPRLSVVYPQNVVNLQIDYEGEIDWISIRKANGDIVVYDREEFVVLQEAEDKGYVEIERDSHGFSSVPVVRFMYRKNTAVNTKPKMGHAFMYSVIKKSLGALKYCTMLVEAVHYHLFPKVIMSDETFKQTQKMGTGAATPIIEPSGADQANASTRYLETSTTEIDALQNILYERIPKAIYRAARLRDRSTEMEQSGISKAFDMVPEVAVLTQISDYLYDGDYKILSLMAEARGRTTEVKLEYPTTFDTKSITELVREVVDASRAQKEAGLPQSATANRLLAERINSQMLPDVEDKEWSAILNDFTNSEKAKSDLTPEFTLNGAQVQAATEIVRSVARGEFGRESGIGQLMVLFNLTTDQAELIMGKTGNSAPVVEEAVEEVETTEVEETEFDR